MIPNPEYKGPWKPKVWEWKYIGPWNIANYRNKKIIIAWIDYFSLFSIRKLGTWITKENGKLQWSTTQVLYLLIYAIFSNRMHHFLKKNKKINQYDMIITVCRIRRGSKYLCLSEFEICRHWVVAGKYFL